MFNCNSVVKSLHIHPLQIHAAEPNDTTLDIPQFT